MFTNELVKTELPDIEERLTKCAHNVLSNFYDETPDFCVSFVEADAIQALNHSFREVDAVTDVLSFPSDGEIDPDSGMEYIGDIAICVERAAEQAVQSGHSTEDEIILLMIHGLLHLLGYDHDTDEAKKEMWKLQDEYLAEAGCHLGRYPGEEFDS